jgi:hypothetical protein
LDIVQFLQGAVKSALVSLGLMYTITVSFDPATVERRSASECVVSVRLNGAVTPEIAGMLRQSTRIVISYSLTLYTERDTKIQIQAVTSAQYRSITGAYSVDSEGMNRDGLSFTQAADGLTSASFTFDPSGVRFAVIKAFLDIPDVRDKNAVKSLWGDTSPTMVVDLTPGA